MESSEEDDDFPSIESITPQSKIDSLYQSNTEKVFFCFSFSFFAAKHVSLLNFEFML